MKLPPKYNALVEAALKTLAARHPKSAETLTNIKRKINAEETLLEGERGFLALAILGAGMELGPESHSTLVKIARQLGVETELLEASRNYLDTVKAPRIEAMPEGTPHNGLCESLWKPGLTCPNQAEFIIRNRKNKGYAVMCGPHAQGFLETYRGGDLDIIAYSEEALRGLLGARLGTWLHARIYGRCEEVVAPREGVQSVGTVRVWHTEEGWGVIDCPDTPGGCWVHFSHLFHEDIPAPGPGRRGRAAPRRGAGRSRCRASPTACG